MDIHRLMELTREYQQKCGEHNPPPDEKDVGVDVCAHLHHEVSELWNALRKQKPKEDVVDHLADVLCLWLLSARAVEQYSGEPVDMARLVDDAAAILRRVASNKHGVELQTR